jgi:hypothetical protein
MTERGFIAWRQGLRPAGRRRSASELSHKSNCLASMPRRCADPDARYGERGILNTKNPAVSLGNAPASVDVLYSQYCVAHARWHSTKSESDRIAVRETYEAWATAFLGEVSSRPVIISAARFWGAA